ncbi:hypothetical protein NLO95_08800 [Pseudomonas syringae]|nr:hypothetical protein [Pseudomonas syringae]
MVKLFDTSSAAQEVFDEVEHAGIAAIHGGRVSVRNLGGLVGNIASSQRVNIDQEGGYFIAGRTFNHPETELAYLYDARRYDSEQALKLAIEAYDELNCT